MPMKQIMLLASPRYLSWLVVAGTMLGHLPPVAALDLREAKFTQVVNSVMVTNAQGQNGRQAVVDTAFVTPDIIRTGISSRAELTAADQTVTRVGANTIFSFKPEGRGINLQQGSVLFNSPTGRGGGTIQTAAATASVLGTTIIVSTTSNGGFKLLVIEGKAKATLPNGRDFVLKAGQMTFITPGMTRAPQVFEFRLSKQTEGSNLLQGFNNELPAQEKVQQAIQVQDVQIANGDKADTGLMIGSVVGNEVQLVDPNLIQTAMQTLAQDQDAAAIAKFKTAVTVNSTISSTLFDEQQTVYFSTADALKRGLEAVGDTSNKNGLPKTTWVYAAKNLNFATGLPIDLSAYTDADTFAFYGKESISIVGNLDIGYFPGEVTIRSQGDLSLMGTSYSFDAREASLVAHSASTWVISGKSFTNTGGQLRIENEGGGKLSLVSNTFTGQAVGSLHAIQLESAGDMELIGGTYNTSGPSGTVGLGIDVQGTLTLSSFVFNSATQSVRITGGSGGDAFLFGTSSITADEFSISGKNNATVATTNITANNIKLAVVGSVNLSNGTFTAANNLNVTGRNITVNTSSFSSTAPSTGTATFSGGTGATDEIHMSSVNFNTLYNFNSVSMQAYTITFTNVDFSSATNYTFKSRYGLNSSINMGTAAIPGYVNFTTGNTVGGVGFSTLPPNMTVVAY